VEKAAGPRYTTTTWMERNRQLLNALRMERSAVTIITHRLIELVAALNILIVLVMMVMEKYRDIAILMSMGARRPQIRRSSCCKACSSESLQRHRPSRWLHALLLRR